MSTKRRALLAVLVPAGVLAILTTQTWVTGTSGDVLSHGPTDVTGNAAMPGVLGLCLVSAAALLALLTGGRVIRAVSATLLCLAALGTFVLVLLVALRPAQVVAAAVAQELARTTVPEATGNATALAWLAAIAALALVAGGVRAATWSRGWGGLGARYERAGRPVAGPRGEVRSAWDELSDGHDPTLGEDPGKT
jgi:hypothetical protein